MGNRVARRLHGSRATMQPRKLLKRKVVTTSSRRVVGYIYIYKALETGLLGYDPLCVYG